MILARHSSDQTSKPSIAFPASVHCWPPRWSRASPILKSSDQVAISRRANGLALPCPDRRIGASTWPGGVATIDDGADRWARADISRFEMVSKRRDRTAVVPTSYRSDASIAQLTDNFSLEPVRAASERVSELRKTCRARPKTENSNEKTMASALIRF
jgi:hypothetical protein